MNTSYTVALCELNTKLAWYECSSEEQFIMSVKKRSTKFVATLLSIKKRVHIRQPFQCTDSR